MGQAWLAWKEAAPLPRDSFGDSATRLPQPCGTRCPRNALPLSLPGESVGPMQKPPVGHEPKQEAHIRLACLHQQLSSKAQPQAVKPLLPAQAQFLPMARKGISDCTSQMNGSIKTYSLLKMHLFTTAWGRQTTSAVYREFRFFSPLCLCTSSPSPPIRQVIWEINLIHSKIFL